MKLFTIFAVCLCAYAIVLFSLPVQIFPEFFFYPWLVSKGLVQYRDFFDHHGFFTNILLSPFARNLPLLSFFFISGQIVQFGAVAYLIYKKVKQPLLYFLLLTLYCSVQFAVVQQQMWFDVWIAHFLILSWFLFEVKREYPAWVFVAFATMIKPTVLLFLIPFFLHLKNKKSILLFFVLWIFPLFYFFSRGAIGEMWRQLIQFNYLYIRSTYSTFFIGISIKLLLSLSIGFVFTFFISLREKQKNIPLLLTTLISFLFFFQGFSKINFALFVPFFILLIAEIVQKKRSGMLVGIIVFLCIIFLRDAYKTYFDLRKKEIYLSSTVVQEAQKIAPLLENKKDKTVLVVGNRVELYYLLTILPPEFSPLHFPWIDKLYPSTLSLNTITHIIVPKKLREYEAIIPSVARALQKDFSQVRQTASYTIWRYNRR